MKFLSVYEFFYILSKTIKIIKLRVSKENVQTTTIVKIKTDEKIREKYKKSQKIKRSKTHKNRKSRTTREIDERANLFLKDNFVMFFSSVLQPKVKKQPRT